MGPIYCCFLLSGPKQPKDLLRRLHRDWDKAQTLTESSCFFWQRIGSRRVYELNVFLCFFNIFFLRRKESSELVIVDATFCSLSNAQWELKL